MRLTLRDLRRASAPGLESAMLSATVPSNRKLSCSTDAELRSVVAQPDVVEVAAVDQDAALSGAVERHDQARSACSSRSARAHQRRGRAGAAVERDVASSTGTPGLYSKPTSSNSMPPSHDSSGASRAAVASSSVAMPADLADAVEAGEGLADLRADRGELEPSARRAWPVNERYMTKLAERHACRRGWRGRRPDHHARRRRRR